MRVCERSVLALIGILFQQDQYMFLIEAVLDIERIKSTTYPARLQAADFIAICNSINEGENNHIVKEFEVCKVVLWRVSVCVCVCV